MSQPNFFTFRRAPDWNRGLSRRLQWTERGYTLVQEQVYRHVRRHVIEHPHIEWPIMDTAADSDRWFFLDGGGMIWRTDLSSGHLETVLSQNLADCSPSARIAVSRDSLILMDPEAGDVLKAMSSDYAQIRWTVSDWQGEAFTGLAIAPVHEGGVLVLAAFDDSLHLLHYDASGGEAGHLELGPILAEPEDTNHQTPRGEIRDRFELSPAPDGHCWLLDRESRKAVYVDWTAKTAEEVPIPGETGPVLAICPAAADACWLLAGFSPKQHSLIRLHTDGRVHEHTKLGAIKGMRLIPGNRHIQLWDPEEHSIHNLQPRAEPAVWKLFGRRLGVWISGSLDSAASGTEWHKIVLSVTGSADTQVNLRYYASDHKEAVLGKERVLLDAYIADPAIPDGTKLAALAPIWSDPLRDPGDALLMRAKGRYLWLFMELIGSEQHAPAVHSLEVHFPRASYLEYLPAIYQQDEQSSDFLARYLSMFQTLMDDTDRHIRRVTASFDTDSVTGASLQWLLGWLGIQADDNWTEAQLRDLLKQASVLYHMRGTPYAMESVIAIYTGEKPIILEYEQVKPLKENAELAEVVDRLYEADPQTFHVLVKLEHADTERKRVTLQQLIDAFKPAFATGKLIVLQPWVYMDLHSYLGMNTVLSEPDLLKLDGRSSMPHHTITIDVKQDNRMDRHTRLGLDSRLD